MAGGPGGACPIADLLLTSAEDGPASNVSYRLADFECPACAAAEKQFSEAFPGDSAPIIYEFRHFPKTQMHPQAEAAAIASECAVDQGRFGDVKRDFFEHQRDLERLVHDVAERHALNRERFAACQASAEPTRRVQRDMADGRALGVRGVPTIIIGRTAFLGVLPAAKLRARVAAELRDIRRAQAGRTVAAGLAIH